MQIVLCVHVSQFWRQYSDMVLRAGVSCQCRLREMRAVEQKKAWLRRGGWLSRRFKCAKCCWDDMTNVWMVVNMRARYRWVVALLREKVSVAQLDRASPS